MGVIKKLFDIRQDEWPRFSLLFLAFFIFNVGMAWAGASTRGIVVAEFGDDFIKYGFVFYGIATIIVSIGYTAFVDRVPKHLLLVIMTAGSAVLIAINAAIAFVPELRSIGAVGLFVFYKVILLVWVLQWKTTLLDFYDTRTSKRILPLLGTGRLLGIAAGGFFFSTVVKRLNLLSAETFFWLWCGTLVLATVIIWLIPRLMRDEPFAWPQTEDGYLDSIREGFQFIANSTYLKWMTVSALLMNAQIALFEISSSVLANDYYNSNADAVSAFFADIDATFSVVFLIVQLFIFPRILSRLGLGNVNLIYPIASFGVGGALALATTGFFGRFFLIGSSAAAYIDVEPFRRVFRSPINGLLINAVPAYMKGRARSVINGIISRFADILIGLAVLIETIPIPGGRSIPASSIFVGLAVVISAAYAYTAFALKREYGRAMVKLLEQEDYTALLSQDYELGVVDSAMLDQLRTKLEEAEDVELRQFIANLLIQTGQQEAVDLLIDYAQNADQATLLAILETLIESEARSDGLRQFYIRHLGNAHPGIRRAALEGIMQVVGRDEEIRFKIADDHLHDVDPVVRGEMVKALLMSSNAYQRDKATRTLQAMLRDFDSDVRVQAARVMHELGHVDFVRHLVELMEDDSDDVRLAATLAIEAIWRDDMPTELVQLILDREHMLLDDPVERIRQAELAVLGKIGRDSAARALVRALDDSSSVVQKAAMKALERLGKHAEPALVGASKGGSQHAALQAMIVLTRTDRDQYDHALLTMTMKTLDTIYKNHTVLAVFAACTHYPTFVVLDRYFEERNETLLETVFDALRTLYDPKSIDTIHETLRSSIARTRINAVEALESLSTPELARQIAPLLDGSTSESLAQVYYERNHRNPMTANDIIRQLVDDPDTWLKAVMVVALGEIAAENPHVRQLILGAEAETTHVESELTACQELVSPQIIAVALQAAIKSPQPEIRRAGRAAMRYVRGVTMEHYVAEMKNKEVQEVLTTIERMIYLKRVSFFQSLSVDQLKALANICDEAVLKRGELIFKQGDEGGSLYIVLSGRIEVGLTQEDTFMHLAYYDANTAFGEMSLFDGQPRSADARADHDSLVLTVRREPFLALARQFPGLALNLITVLSDRLRAANLQIGELNTAMRQSMDV